MAGVQGIVFHGVEPVASSLPANPEPPALRLPRHRQRPLRRGKAFGAGEPSGGFDQVGQVVGGESERHVPASHGDYSQVGSILEELVWSRGKCKIVFNSHVFIINLFSKTTTLPLFHVSQFQLLVFNHS